MTEHFKIDDMDVGGDDVVTPSIIESNSSMSKRDFLDTLRKRSKVLQELRSAKESMFPKTWNATKINNATKMVERTNTAAGVMSSIPLRCRASKCPYSQGCQLLKAGLHVENETCPIEMHLLIGMYVGFCEELLINPDEDYIDAALVRDLCNVLIQEIRTEKVLGDEHFVMENIMSIDKMGNPIYHKEPHIAITYSEKLHRKKMEIMEVLLATRIAKVKAAKTLGANMARKNEVLSQMADLLAKVTAPEAMKRREDAAFDIESADFVEEADFEEIDDESSGEESQEQIEDEKEFDL
jgi:hypothetical protein